ncbi:MAG: ABC transporter permease [Candidatus Aramenus sulfurataquae]|uniref:ABC transporter permease n=1 Tax=Candidatus Aramenus sulfurataquae TaxID=1326980 RepID=W7KNJ9_9CREN|nr:MAG: ABC transporter permease [Candidatus Aramenus sulfurataquae]
MIEKIVTYEIKRAVARKKVITIIGITLLFEVGVYVALSQVKTPRIETILGPISSLLWLVGVLLPQSLLLHFITISISSGALSEEYEQGTVDFFLTKPITRLQFLTGKYLGGFLLVTLVYAFMVFLSLMLSELLFGSQIDLGYLPALFLSVEFSSLTFFSIAFMIGEVLRRSSLAFLISSTVLIGSILIGTVLEFVSRLTGSSIFTSIAIALPAWGAVELPYIYAQGIPNASLIVQALEIFPAISGTEIEAIAYVVLYSGVSTVLAFVSFLNRDIPKRVS